jgi:hypothetical protein
MLLFFIAFCATVRAQDVAPYLVAINQSAAEAALLTDQAAIRWEQTTALFAATNDALGYAVGNMSVVYNASSVSAAAFRNASYANGDCVVGPFVDFIENQTKTIDFLCCHTRKLRAPGLLLTYTQMCAAYFPGCVGQSDATSTLLAYIRQVTSIATVGIIGAACLDDVDVMIPDRAIALGISAESPGHMLLQAYQDLAASTASLFACVDGLSARCAVNGTLTAAQAPYPDTAFPDAAFDAVCGPATLAAFDLSRFATPCAQQSIPAS